MKTFLELQEEGLVKPIIKNKYGFKIPERDLEILVEMCRNSQFAERIKLENIRSDAYLSDLLKFYIRGNDGDFKPITVSDSEFEKLENQNAMFRATSNEAHNINHLLNSKVVLRDGDNGSGIYFSEGVGSFVPRYVISHLKDKPVNENVGNIYKVALNPDASVVDRIFLYNTIKELKKAVDNGCYADGTKLTFGCDKELLKKVLSNDFSVVALLMGANAIYVPLKETAMIQNQFKFLGHFILLDKNPIIVPKETSQLNARVDITNLKNNPTEEIAKIQSVLTKK